MNEMAEIVSGLAATLEAVGLMSKFGKIACDVRRLPDHPDHRAWCDDVAAVLQVATDQEERLWDLEVAEEERRLAKLKTKRRQPRAR